MSELENVDIDVAYETVINNICSNEGQTVLLLGPEICVSTEGESYKAHFKKYAQDSEEGYVYFDSDNLFTYKDKLAERKLRLEFNNFYKNAGDQNLLELISRIKFPLIINAFPDISINNTYKDNNIEFKSSYFSKSNKSESLPRPSKGLPIIYNIFGSIENDQSLIINHGNLYKTIEDLMSNSALPTSIFEFLDGVKSYVFLGFKFDSWYYQLLCHKLRINGFSPEDKICLSETNIDFANPISIIVKNHFRIDFANENPTQIIERLIKGIEEKDSDSLRKPSPGGKYSVFISYARHEEASKNEKSISRESIVDLIQEKLKSDVNIKVFRDRNELTYGDSIDSFMNLIGKGKTVIIIVSEKYLQSQYCLEEALRIKKYSDKDKRVFVVLYEDFKLDDNTPVTFKSYWKEKITKMLDERDDQIKDKIERARFAKSNNTFIDLHDFVDEFINYFKDNIFYSVTKDDFQKDNGKKVLLKSEKKDNFEGFINAIISKIKT